MFYDNEEFDFSQTGDVQSGGGTVWMRVHGKEGRLLIRRNGDWEAIDGFAGRLENFKCVWDEGDAQRQAQFKYQLTFKCADNERRAIDFGSRTVTVTPTILNAVLAAVRNPSWNGYFSLKVWPKRNADTGEVRVGMKISTNMKTPDEHAPVVYPFNSSTNRLDGVPIPKTVMVDGKNLKEWNPVIEFWHKAAEEIAVWFAARSGTQAISVAQGTNRRECPTAESALNGNHGLVAYNDAILFLRDHITPGLADDPAIIQFNRLKEFATQDGYLYNTDTKKFESAEAVVLEEEDKLPF